MKLKTKPTRSRRVGWKKSRLLPTRTAANTYNNTTRRRWKRKTRS